MEKRTGRAKDGVQSDRRAQRSGRTTAVGTTRKNTQVFRVERTFFLCPAPPRKESSATFSAGRLPHQTPPATDHQKPCKRSPSHRFPFFLRCRRHGTSSLFVETAPLYIFPYGRDGIKSKNPLTKRDLRQENLKNILSLGFVRWVREIKNCEDFSMRRRIANSLIAHRN